MKKLVAGKRALIEIKKSVERFRYFVKILRFI